MEYYLTLCDRCGHRTSKAYAQQHDGLCKPCSTGQPRELRPEAERLADSESPPSPGLCVKTWYNGFGPKIRSDSFVWMKAGIAAGEIPAPCRCQACGETRGHIDYHTEDYSRPFGPHIYGFELCFRCHMMLHVRFRRPQDWFRYVDALEDGAVFEPLMHRGEIGKINGSDWIDSPVASVEPRGPLEFFRSLSVARGDEPDMPVEPMTAPVARERTMLLFD
jgi:hypothetical protein